MRSALPLPIPLNDLRRHTDTVKKEIHEAVEKVLTSGQYILGPCVERFEAAFAEYCGVQHTVGVANGTDALELALQALGCQAGDGVVTVANAGGYATTAILHNGAIPEYADIDPHTFLMTPQTLLEALTPVTKAVIVTHLYGLMADMPALCKVAADRGIAVIEDCAQAHGASLAGKKAGSWGALGCFSFYPTKNLGGIGDAGCIITNNATFADHLRALRQYGWQKHKYHALEHIGRNSRMDELQAAVLVQLLPYLDGWNDNRRHVVQRYREALGSCPIVFQHIDTKDSFAAHLAVIRTPDRDALMQALQDEHVATAVHYPVADYAQPAVVRRIGTRTELPNTEQVIQEILSLPCFPEMLDAEVDRIIHIILSHVSRNNL